MKYEAGDIFAVDILLNTEGIDVIGVDVMDLDYPTNLLEVQDEDPGTPGVQITFGTLLSTTMFPQGDPSKVVDPINGKITFSQIAFIGTPSFTGSGTFATIRFKALDGGSFAPKLTFAPKIGWLHFYLLVLGNLQMWVLNTVVVGC